MMSEQWPIIPLRDLCEDFKKDIVDGPFGSNLKREHYTDQGITVLKIQNIKPFKIKLHKIDYVSEEKAEELKRHSFTKGDIIMTKLGNPLGVSAIVEELEEGIIVADLVRIRAQKINTKFLCYQLNSSKIKAYINSLQKGTTRPRVRIGIVRDIPIVVPPLEEQERIVKILDEAFVKIHNLEEQLQQKIAYAKEIYFSVIHSQEGDKAPLGNFVDIKTGKLNSNAAVEGGQYPFFTCSRKPSEIDYHAFDCEAILLAGNNASGDFNVKHYSGKFNAYQRTYVITISDKENLTYRYLYHQMVKSLKELKSSSVGSGTKFLKLGMIKDLQINVPSFEKQQILQEQIDNLEEESEKLEENYLCELEMLGELKQSLLQESFSVNITREIAV